MKKAGLILLLSCALPVLAASQVSLPVYPDSIFNTYYWQRFTHFRTLPRTKGDIIFVGNSITDGSGWGELFNDLHVKNRGISGDNTAGVLNRLTEITDRKPAKVFLMIGVNDLSRNTAPDSIVKNICLAVAFIHQETPSTKIYVQSILPVNPVFGKFGGHTGKKKEILQADLMLRERASGLGYTYIDLHTSFADANGALDTQLTNDGLHLKGSGYALWKHIVFPYVYDLQQKPSLLPAPRSLSWRPGYFRLYECQTIVATDPASVKTAAILQQDLADMGRPMTIVKNIPADLPCILLSLDKVDAPSGTDEAYRLDVDASRISIHANTAHGLFNAVQTLHQLMRDDFMVDNCSIRDWPSFPFRGYMVDVGRNYQSVNLLKEQIGVMARYKLNVFHLHLTENIAWRLESKVCPALNSAANMTRNSGEYYSFDELNELIRYCADRYITLIPELDMPGHSDAFKRATGYDMQSPEGMELCRKLLNELMDHTDLPYIHIGGDEVKITNKQFLPDMYKVVAARGKKVIAWSPGGEVPDGTIRQLWQGQVKPMPGVTSIDSRHLYLNHMDPYDAVTAIFNHRMDDVAEGDEQHPGAILCLWPDRRVSREEDIIRMNPVYPGMLAFAERCWAGGGWKNYASDFGLPGSDQYNAFSVFEDRFCDQQKLYFGDKPFFYSRQAETEWSLIGPFDNKGNTAAVFRPETIRNYDSLIKLSQLKVYGGTIWLRHFWSPLIGSHVASPAENSTWYAVRRIYSETEKEVGFWIGFYNISRSNTTPAPPQGAWDERGSRVWINGILVQPPHWKRSSSLLGLEDPLTDEGYEYRNPVIITLEQGWNTILVKAPVASFKATNWNIPVKWMFTVMADE